MSLYVGACDPLTTVRGSEGNGEVMRVKSSCLKASLAVLVVVTLSGVASAQTATDVPDERKPRTDEAAVAHYFDPAAGLTADEAVARALASNGEVLAMRKELEAARALVRQAGVRPNPRLDVSGAKALNMPDRQLMVEGMMPLELGGRRAARVLVAEREFEVK